MMDTMSNLALEVKSLMGFLGLKDAEVNMHPDLQSILGDEINKDVTALTYSVKDRFFSWYSAQESDHNGDHYDCTHKSIKPTIKLMKRLKESLLKLASDKAFENIEKEKERSKRYEVVQYLRAVGIQCDLEDVKL